MRTSLSLVSFVIGRSFSTRSRHGVSIRNNWYHIQVVCHSFTWVLVILCGISQGTDIVERFWARIGSWIVNKRAVRVLDAMGILSNMAFEDRAKHGIGETDRVGYQRQGTAGCADLFVVELMRVCVVFRRTKGCVH